MKEEEHLELYGGLGEEIGTKLYRHGPMDYAKTLKLRFRVGDLGLPETRKRYQYSGGGSCTDVPLWQRNREYNSHSEGM